MNRVCLFFPVTETYNIKGNMPDKKQICKNCKTRHLPPTGKKYQFKDSVESDKSVSNGLRDAATLSKLLDTDQADLGR